MNRIGQQCCLDWVLSNQRIRGVRGDQTTHCRKAHASVALHFPSMRLGALHTNPILLNHSKLRGLSYVL